MKYILSLLLIFVTFTTFSQIPKPLKDTYVNDFAKVLSKSEIKKLNDTIKQIEKKSGVQLALVIVNKIPKEYDIEEYSLIIARRWKVGNKEDGLVYVAAVKQRKQRLEVAYNLETIFNAETSQDALAKTKAHFRLKDYGKGLFALVSDIAFKLDSAGYGEPPAVQSLVAVDKQEAKTVSHQKSDHSLSLLGFFGIAFATIVVMLIIRLFRRRPSGPPQVGGDYGGYNNGYDGGYNGGRRSGMGSFFAGAATGYFANSFLNRNRYHNNVPLLNKHNRKNVQATKVISAIGDHPVIIHRTVTVLQVVDFQAEG
ncbi:TPM domain-containing protein [Pedobacter sp. HDW13]|uniref:TPM domain-containing protein n=1 Tax=Pedobacter sp. HDW13 TaxID=2714940 RepID=UPI001408D30C|nr:TPM domain-containing protein [Pedobacter sp. HDW13]QIL39337.1 TPM domain-containing protein [Pedobacter sp. HDW13]